MPTTVTDRRDHRAATEAMVVVEDAPLLFEVYSGEQSVYTVDAVAPACTCEDYQYRDRKCKHIRRLEMTLGMRAIPEGVDPDPVLLRQRDYWATKHNDQENGG